MTTSPTILVTGASGHLGRLAVHALLERGVAAADVVATARRTDGLDDLAALGVTIRRLDYDDVASIDAALAGVDRVLLVSSNDVGNRVPQHRAVIDAAARAGVSLLAYTSILRADTSSLALARSHAATEAALAESGVPHVLLRNGWYLENYTENAAPALATGTVIGAAGAGRVSAAARADYAAAAAAVLTASDASDQAGRIYELAGDTSFTLAEYAAALGRAADREITYTDLSVEEYAAALTSVGVPASFAEMLADGDRGLAAGELEDTSRTLSTLIGRPTTSLDEALRQSAVLVA